MPSRYSDLYNLALSPLFVCLVAFETDAGMPKCWLITAVVVSVSCYFLTSLLESVDSGALCKIRFSFLLSFSLSFR